MKNSLINRVLLFVLMSLPLGAAMAKDKEHASVSLAPTSIAGKAGDTVSVKLTLSIAKGWHAYDLEQAKRNGDSVGPNAMEISAKGNEIR